MTQFLSRFLADLSEFLTFMAVGSELGSTEARKIGAGRDIVNAGGAPPGFRESGKGPRPNYYHPMGYHPKAVKIATDSRHSRIGDGAYLEGGEDRW